MRSLAVGHLARHALLYGIHLFHLCNRHIQTKTIARAKELYTPAADAHVMHLREQPRFMRASIVPVLGEDDGDELCWWRGGLAWRGLFMRVEGGCPLGEGLRHHRADPPANQAH